MQEPLRVPGGEIRRRIHALQREIVALGVQAALIAQRIDLLYFSGCAQNGYLYVPAEGEPLLMVRKHPARAEKDSPLPGVCALESVRQIPERILERYGRLPRVLGMAWDVLPTREFGFFRSILSPRALVDVSGAIHGLRAIKSGWEVERMEKAASVCSETLDHLLGRTGPVLNEARLAGLAEAFARRRGHGGGIRVRFPHEDDRSAWLDGPEGTPPNQGPVSAGFRAVVDGYHAASARLYARDAGSSEEGRVAGLLRNVHASILERGAACPSLEAFEEAAGLAVEGLSCGRSCPEIRWSLFGIGLELHEPLPAAASKSLSEDESVCFVLQSGLRTPSGLSPVLQDTLCLTAGRGLRCLGHRAETETSCEKNQTPTVCRQNTRQEFLTIFDRFPQAVAVREALSPFPQACLSVPPSRLGGVSHR